MIFRRALLTAALLSLGTPLGLAPQESPPDISDLQAREIGPAVMSGRIVDLAVVEMDPVVFYLATSTGGLWKTTNNAVTLTPLFTEESVHSIGDVAVHQVDTSLVWVGTGERASRQSSSWGDGVYRSRDGGESWENVGLGDSHHIGRIALHPTDTRTVYVAAMGHLWGPNQERGLYKSTDGGDSWDRILFVDEDTGVVDVALDDEGTGDGDGVVAEDNSRRFGDPGKEKAATGRLAIVKLPPPTSPQGMAMAPGAEPVRMSPRENSSEKFMNLLTA